MATYWIHIKMELDDYIGQDKPMDEFENLTLAEANQKFNEARDNGAMFVRMGEEGGCIVRDYCYGSKDGFDILPNTDYAESVDTAFSGHYRVMYFTQGG